MVAAAAGCELKPNAAKAELTMQCNVEIWRVVEDEWVTWLVCKLHLV